ncbi:helix-turn-helix transcriptional regulator [Amycolatopsis sp. NPDC089917]|uniref:helix-turn-helix domain-containing protein n=1 Tax=Amycolatopsis sp. NPDC089917 TaxID=3155187 RepID=UPI00344AD801
MCNVVAGVDDASDDAYAMHEVIRVQSQLARIRKSRGWSQLDVGNKLNVHPSTVWRWENNPTYACNISELQMYARVLGYTFRVLIIANDDDKPGESPQLPQPDN